jgi:hypothetical protein
MKTRVLVGSLCALLLWPAIGHAQRGDWLEQQRRYRAYQDRLQDEARQRYLLEDMHRQQTIMELQRWQQEQQDRNQDFNVFPPLLPVWPQD